MAASKFKATDVFADQFVISAGSVLFKISHAARLRICILHNRLRGEWWLPKGRKNRGESMQNAAVRETSEETGFRCSLFPVNLRTRATIPGFDHKDVPQLEPLSSEPIALTVRHISDVDVKTIWWFVTRVEGDIQHEGTRTESENFDAVLLDAEEAIDKLTFSGDKEIAKRALELVTATVEVDTLVSPSKEDLLQRGRGLGNLTAVGILVLSMTAAAVIWWVKPE